MIETPDFLLRFVEAVLNDDHGISDKAHLALCDLANAIDHPAVTDLLRRIDATEGRFYLK